MPAELSVGGVHVRAVRPEEGEAALALVASVPEAPAWTDAVWLEFLQANDGESGGLRRKLLCVDAGREGMLGLAAVTLLGETTELESLLVHTASRRHGLGLLLCKGWLQWAEAEGAQTALLEVRAGNAGALRLYRGLGFREQGRRLRYYQQPPDDAVMMALSLPLQTEVERMKGAEETG